MTRDERFFPDDAALDQQWDDLVQGHAGLTTEPVLRDLHTSRPPAGPSPMFRAQLRAMIQTAAAEMPGATRTEPIRLMPGVPATAETARPQPVPVIARPRYSRMRGLTGVSKAASVLLAASLLVAMLASVVRNPFGGSSPTDTPASGAQTAIPAASGSPESAGSGPSSADPGRTNQQPGPAPMSIPQLVGRADVRGSAMALGGNTIVIVDNDTVTALDAGTLKRKWAVDVPYGVYSPPVIAGDAVYFGFTGQRDGTTEWLLGTDQPNQLVSLSLKDGSENWRIDGAGSAPVAPLVVNGTIYAVGTTKDAYRLTALDAADGHTLWTAGAFVSLQTGGHPAVIPYIWMRLAYEDGLIAVNQSHGLSVYDTVTGEEVWAHAVDAPDSVDVPLIADGTVVVTIGHQSGDADAPGSAKVVAFNLRTGQEQWAREPVTGNVFLNVSAAQRGDDIVWTQFNAVNEWVASAASLVNGKQAWSVPSWDTAADPGPNFWQPRDSTVVAGDQLFTLGLVSDRGNQARTLVTAREIATGDIAWSAIIDGTAKVAPIIAGGKVYVLTDLYGLQVLGGSESTATPWAGTADLRGPDECAATPIEYPLLGTPEAEGTPIPEWARWGEILPLSEVPAVDPAKAAAPDVATAIENTLAAYRACMVQGDPQLLFGLFSTDYWQRLRGMEGWNFDGKNGERGQTAVMLAGSNERIDLDPATLQSWPDGRVGGIVHGNTDMYVWFVEDGGTWRVDEFHHIMDTSPIPEPSPSPEE
jgi:hypothetical protein